jgi:hypothetical protein
VGTLAGQFHLTQRKVQAVLSHIMGMRFSLGAVSQAHGLVSRALECWRRPKTDPLLGLVPKQN